jgi:hypothetical protein
MLKKLASNSHLVPALSGLFAYLVLLCTAFAGARG